MVVELGVIIVAKASVSIISSDGYKIAFVVVIVTSLLASIPILLNTTCLVKYMDLNNESGSNA